MYTEGVGNTYINLFKISVRRGENGFDGPNGHIGHDLGNKQWILVALIIVLTLIWLWFVFKCQCCPNKKRFPRPIHILISEDEISRIDWSVKYEKKGCCGKSKNAWSLHLFYLNCIYMNRPKINILKSAGIKHHIYINLFVSKTISST